LSNLPVIASTRPEEEAEEEARPMNPNESSSKQKQEDPEEEAGPMNPNESSKRKREDPEEEVGPMNPNESSKRKQEDESDCPTCKKGKVSYVHTKASFKLTNCQYAASISIDIKFSSAVKKSSVKISVMMDREKK
jgi:hypothetical protein